MIFGPMLVAAESTSNRTARRHVGRERRCTSGRKSRTGTAQEVRDAEPAAAGPGVADLRFRLSEHAAEIDKLRSEIEGLAEEIVARDAETELLLMDLAAAGIADADDPRAARWRTHHRLRRFVREHSRVVAGSWSPAKVTTPF